MMSLAASPFGVLHHAGFTFDEIGSWTFYQVRMMIAEETELGGTVKMTPGQAVAFREARRDQREKFVENLMRSRVWRGPLGE